METRKYIFGNAIFTQFPPLVQQDFRYRLRPTQGFNECQNALKTFSKQFREFHTGHDF